MYSTSALAIGSLISLMLFANGALQVAFGATLSVVILHAIGTVILLFLLFFKRASFEKTERINPVLYSAGALGVGLVVINNSTIATIGLTMTIAFGIVGQLIASSFIDHYGWFNLEKRRGNPKKLIGFLLILAGIAVMAWPRD